ncbi:FxsA family protein, partial [Halonatronum saccharophilum]|uniref:FxsA family protein n=1 Tax=Halonatronum saccharophilum TaxID=150060 RepID=UPI0006847B2C
MFKLIFIFTIIPLIELALLVKMSNSFGLSFIITLVTITGLLGGALTKHQGKETINKINDSLAQNQLPADNLMNGLLVLIGGVLLITPGVLTDIGGFT